MKMIPRRRMFKNQILELKQVIVKLHNEIRELEQYGRRSCIRIDGIPQVPNKSSEDVFDNIVEMFVKAGIEDIEQNTDRAHYIGKSYHHRISKKVQEDKSEIYFVQILQQGLQAKDKFTCTTLIGLKATLIFNILIKTNC